MSKLRAGLIQMSLKGDTAGEPEAIRDAMIAATALEHGLTLVTRNVRDFQATGARLLNPWKGV